MIVSTLLRVSPTPFSLPIVLCSRRLICEPAHCIIHRCQPRSWTTAKSPVVSAPAAYQPNEGPATVKYLDIFPLTATLTDLQKLTLFLLLPVSPVQAIHQFTRDAHILPRLRAATLRSTSAIRFSPSSVCLVVASLWSVIPLVTSLSRYIAVTNQ